MQCHFCSNTTYSISTLNKTVRHSGRGTTVNGFMWCWLWKRVCRKCKVCGCLTKQRYRCVQKYKLVFYSTGIQPGRIPDSKFMHFFSNCLDSDRMMLSTQELKQLFEVTGGPEWAALWLQCGLSHDAGCSHDASAIVYFLVWEVLRG